jgi:hypothetical protein
MKIPVDLLDPYVTTWLQENSLGLHDLSIALGYKNGTLTRRWKEGAVCFDMADEILCKTWNSNAWVEDEQLKVLYFAADLSGPGREPRYGQLRRCAVPGCSVYFRPSVPWQLYCSKACKHRAWRRRKPPSGRYGSRYGTCPHGHDRSPENVRERRDGTLVCRRCNADKMAEKYWSDPSFREHRKNDERQRRLLKRTSALQAQAA